MKQHTLDFSLSESAMHMKQLQVTEHESTGQDGLVLAFVLLWVLLCTGLLGAGLVNYALS